MAEIRVVSNKGEPVMVSGRASAADASQPNTDLDSRFHTYESNPIPWWLTVVWASFLIFGLVYLVVALIE